MNMTGTLGRKTSFSAFVVVGNKNGIAGFGLGRSRLGKSAIRIAKNKAAQRLVYIPRFEDHTGMFIVHFDENCRVYHNMYTVYHRSKVFIHKREKGYGLVCHRVLKSCAEVMGIKDLHCKVENSTKNYQAIVRAFFDALIHQETHHELADRMGYHIVEFRKERGNMPVVVASPTDGKVCETELKDEEEDLLVDFGRLYYGGRCELRKPRKLPFFAYGATAEAWRIKQAEKHAVRNQPHAQIMRLAGLW